MNWLTVARYWRPIVIDEARVELERALSCGSLDGKDESIIYCLHLLQLVRGRRQSNLSSLGYLEDFRSLFRVRNSTTATVVPSEPEAPSSTGKKDVP